MTTPPDRHPKQPTAVEVKDGKGRRGRGRLRACAPPHLIRHRKAAKLRIALTDGRKRAIWVQAATGIVSVTDNRGAVCHVAGHPCPCVCCQPSGSKIESFDPTTPGSLTLHSSRPSGRKLKACVPSRHIGPANSALLCQGGPAFNQHLATSAGTRRIYSATCRLQACAGTALRISLSIPNVCGCARARSKPL